ncbi:inter-alpha-trypsin inhibitor heavy chain H3 isoform X2 [Aethina tumida]|uniref:inter-alpha-trypsin inhibitor heavy chain H3 isoform X2 n=1 Tax=Aethina tumida TaxID=116153 RepID=UPI00214800B6|nr:inter-alpha-trypsin inhibitor heavy chain H3 isoform X2 [Aethina tumida]
MGHLHQFIICLSTFISLAICAPQQSLVISSPPPPLDIPGTSESPVSEAPKPIPKIYEMNLETNVTNRFAKTLITSKVKNAEDEAAEATFSVIIPEQAFITGLIMEIDGKNYTAYVEEKQQAKKTYDEAVLRGQTAAHVSASARDSNRFSVDVNLEPQSKAVFYLTYEELLQRNKDQYEIVLNIHPGQPVKNLNAKVLINETRPLSFVRSPSLRSGNEIGKKSDNLDPEADIKNIDEKTAVVKFSPDVVKQKEYAKELGSKEDDGFAGQFIVQYDVKRDSQGGEVLVDDGYFVHFFAPKDIPAIPKYVVFVLDTSGSMYGIRIQQLKEAMQKILNDLDAKDVFNIVEFNTGAKIWNIDEMKVSYKEGDDYYYSPTVQNETLDVWPPFYSTKSIKNAEKVLEMLQAEGATNIQAALEVALKLIQKNKNDKNQPMIVFLTDGEVTQGESDVNKIIAKISELNTQEAAIFSLSFGDGADREFLRKVSLSNSGFSRHIYEGADAALQLQEFYREISSPLLTKVNFKYVSNVTGLTKTEFPILFDGSELVVAGRYAPNEKFEPAVVDCFGVNGPLKLPTSIEKPVTSIERLWAYLTVKQILQKRETSDNKTQLTKEALDIALKYAFVTDVTSLVVVKPNDTSTVEAEDASKTEFNRRLAYAPLAAGIQTFNSPLSTPLMYYPGRPAYQSFAEDTDSDRIEFESGGYLVYQTTVSPSPLIATHYDWLLSWIDQYGIFTYKNETYNLGVGQTMNGTLISCETPTKINGTCKLLESCNELSSIVKNLDILLSYSCKINEYTGVCCHDVMASSSSPSTPIN